MVFRFKRRVSPAALVRSAMIAALYVVVSLSFAPLSFGVVQIRISEALTLLPVICPGAVAGVTIGCMVSNMIGSAPIDVVIGSLATLVAALLTLRLRGVRSKRLWNLPVAASLPPVLVNAVVIGIELTVLYFENPSPMVYLINMLSVAAGQVISCCVLGLLMIKAIESKPALLKIFEGEPGKKYK